MMKVKHFSVLFLAFMNSSFVNNVKTTKEGVSVYKKINLT